MSKKAKIGMGGTGALSLVLVVVVLSMSIMGMLTLASNRNDDRLGARSAEVAQVVYTLYDQAQRSLANLDGVLQEHADPSAFLPEGMEQQQDCFIWQEQDEQHVLECVVRLEKTDGKRAFVWERCQMISKTEGDEEWN